MKRVFSVLAWPIACLLVSACDRDDARARAEPPAKPAPSLPVDRAPADPTRLDRDRDREQCNAVCDLAVATQCENGPTDHPACVTACEMDLLACGDEVNDLRTYFECALEKGLECHASRGVPAQDECLFVAFRAGSCAGWHTVGVWQPNCAWLCQAAMDLGCENGPRDLAECAYACWQQHAQCDDYMTYLGCALERGLECDPETGAAGSLWCATEGPSQTGEPMADSPCFPGAAVGAGTEP